MRKNALLNGLALGALAIFAVGATAQAQDLTVAWKGAPLFQNDDVTFKVRGRILIDAVDAEFDRGGTGIDIGQRNVRGRQMFLGVEGQLNSRLLYKLEGGAVNGGAWSWDDATIEFKPTEFTSVMVGNIKSFGLENLTSTRFRTFMEQGAFGEVTDANYHLGVVARATGPNWTLSGGVQGDSLNTADQAVATGSVVDAKERMQYVVRGTYAPIMTDNTKLHLGLWARHRDVGDETSPAVAGFTYQTKANTSVAPRFTSTGAIGDRDDTYGAEVALVYKSFSVQAEYANISTTVIPGTNPAVAKDGDITTGYAFVSWWPTGDVRNYDVTKGEFGRPKIKNPLTAGGWGGIELTARYDFADLTDIRGSTIASAPAFAGEYKSWTVGANYYPTSYARVMLNYTQAESDNFLANNDVDQRVIQLRTQLDF